MQFGQFAEKFLGFFVAHFGCLQNHLDDLIALRVFARIGDAAVAQAELLVVLRARRNLEQSLAVDRRHFNLGAEARFPDGDRHFHVDVIALAAEDRMRLDVGGDVEISGRRTHGAGVAFAGNAQPGAVLCAGRDPDFHELFVRDSAIAVEAGQAFLMRPLPLQRGQVRLNFMLPAICDTLPVPPHCGQPTEPASLPPMPWQTAHCS